ncbi:hypothetical protein WISP_57747 [Willisornis vidua]|uniref:Uncharacterized protein n=1 Tax=Willisornis vidua TaxID=1566151 RepID=A0ABQ9DBI2_9PASS|nr:hypothetical protein WISP_57747 [Willisornis vidua]
MALGLVQVICLVVTPPNLFLQGMGSARSRGWLDAVQALLAVGKTWPCLVKSDLPGDLDFSLTLVNVAGPAPLFLLGYIVVKELWKRTVARSGLERESQEAIEALLQCTSKVCASRGGVSKEKMGNL